MDRNGQASPNASADEVIADSVAEETSQAFVARWNHLVSTTNWEKGRIVSQWRQALIEAGAAPAEYSDEAWSRRLQSVTPQHVGRLRRVWDRFGGVYTDYDGLYWSHFQAALDWSDAEMWLEGALSSQWSISDMRRQRATTLAETTGQIADEAVDTTLDNPSADVADSSADDALDEVEVGGEYDSADDATTGERESDAAAEDESTDVEDEPWTTDGERLQQSESDADEPIRPFAMLAELPADLADAFEAFKLAILRHKLSGWSEIACDDVLSVLDGLKQLAVAPSE